MVSYGFEAIEDFYSKSSTRNLIGDVKIPVLFIQVCGLLLLFVSLQEEISRDRREILILKKIFFF